MIYKEVIKKSKSVYQVKCSLFNEPIYFYLWDAIIAFLKKTVGFDVTIEQVEKNTMHYNAAVYVLKDLDKDTTASEREDDADYHTVILNELLHLIKE